MTESNFQTDFIDKLQRRFAAFLYHRKLLKINLAVLHCFNTRKTWIGKQPPAGAQIA